MKEFTEHKPGASNVPIGFLSRSTRETFQKGWMYVEDAYERKEDMRKLDY